MTPATEPAMQNTIIYDTNHFCLMCKVCDDIYESETIEFSPTNHEPRCPECHTVVDYTTTLDFCNCLNDFRYMIHEDFREWASANPSPENLYIIIGSNMGWQRRNGYTIIDGDDDLIDTIGVNSDFTQHWTLPARDAQGHYPAGSTITISQSHHDAPTGESYVLRPLTPEEYLIHLTEDSGLDALDVADTYSTEMQRLLTHHPDYTSWQSLPVYTPHAITHKKEKFTTRTTYEVDDALVLESYAYDEDEAMENMTEAIEIINSWA